MSSDGDLEKYAQGENESLSEKVYLEARDLGTGFTKDSKSFQPTCDKQFPNFHEKELNNRLLEL